MALEVNICFAYWAMMSVDFSLIRIPEFYTTTLPLGMSQICRKRSLNATEMQMTRTNHVLPLLAEFMKIRLQHVTLGVGPREVPKIPVHQLPPHLSLRDVDQILHITVSLPTR